MSSKLRAPGWNSQANGAMLSTSVCSNSSMIGLGKEREGGGGVSVETLVEEVEAAVIKMSDRAESRAVALETTLGQVGQKDWLKAAMIKGKPRQAIVGYAKEFMEEETGKLATKIKELHAKTVEALAQSGVQDKAALDQEKEEATETISKCLELKEEVVRHKLRLRESEERARKSVELKRQVETFEKTVGARDHQIEKLTQELARLREKMAADMASKLGNHETQLLEERKKASAKYSELESSFREQVEALSRDLSMTRKDYDQAAAELNTQRKLSEEMRIQLASLAGERDRLASQVSASETSLQKALDGLNQNQHFAQQRIDMINQEKMRIEESLALARAKVEELSKESANGTKREADALQRAAILDVRIETLKNQVKELEDRHDLESQKSAQILERCEKLEREVVQLTRERDALQSREAEMIKKCATLEEKHASASAKLGLLEEQSESKARQSAATIVEQTKKFQELEKAFGEKSKAYESLSQEFTMLQAGSKLNSTRIDGLEAELAATKAALAQTGSSNEERVAQICELSRENKNLQRELAIVNGVKSNVVELEMRVREFSDLLFKSDKERRDLHNRLQELQGNIRVVARVRPSSSPASNFQASQLSCNADGMGLTLNLASTGSSNLGASKQQQQPHVFTFNRVFAQSAAQEEVFEEVALFVQSALDGYNVCLFSYGQTGSGKTYTMTGKQDNPKHRGIIPRAVDQIFGYATELRTKGWEFEMNASFLEIYNEGVNDLLLSSQAAASGSKKKLDVRQMDSSVSAVGVPGLTQVPITDPRQLHQLLTLADKNRSVAATDANEVSSRSHSVFSIQLRGKQKDRGLTIEGCLSMCDLAGSEKLAKSKAEGDRLTETKSINKSLSSLKSVFTALSSRTPHIPFRDSKLTHLLSPCFSGNGKVLMIINLSPDQEDLQESLTTLRFANLVNSTQLGLAKKTIHMTGTAIAETEEATAAAPDDVVSTTSSSSTN